MSRFIVLPYDILCRIALVARPTDIVRLAITSRELLFRLLSDESLWRMLSRRHFPVSQLEDEWALWCLFEPMGDISLHWRHGRHRILDIPYNGPSRESNDSNSNDSSPSVSSSGSNGSGSNGSSGSSGSSSNGNQRSHLALIQQKLGYTLLYDFARRQLLMMTHRVPKQETEQDSETLTRVLTEVMNLPQGMIPYPYATDAQLNTFFITLRCQRIVELTSHLVLYQRNCPSPFYSCPLPAESKICELRDRWMLIRDGKRNTNWALFDLMENNEPNTWNWRHIYSHCHLQVSRKWQRTLSGSPSEKVTLTPASTATNVSTEVISKLSHLAIFRIYRTLSNEPSPVRWDLLRLRSGTRKQMILRSGEFEPEDHAGFQRKLKSTWLKNGSVLLQSGGHGSKISWLALLSVTRAQLVWEYVNPGELVMNFAEYGFIIQGMCKRHVIMASSNPTIPTTASTSSSSSASGASLQSNAIVELQQICLTNGTILRRLACNWYYHPIRIIGTMCLVGMVDSDGKHVCNCVVDVASGLILCILDMPVDNLENIKNTVATGYTTFNDGTHMRLYAFDY
ncbi:hypothetical protein BDF22DRAFT_675395 [Syncephalis plumigaleata]|nr:hypothetical protein BDF22DRAFT_675395 [Syncephalis plumigaleata]